MAYEYLKNKEVKDLLDAAPTYRKTQETALRLPKKEELGQDFSTYVKCEGGVRIESSTKVGHSVIARNPEIIGRNDNAEDVYNEWVIPYEIAVKNYGQEVIDSLNSDSFSLHKKKATVKAIELTQDIMYLLGTSGDLLDIQVSWSPNPMKAKVGDYLTDQGYSISRENMKDYELFSASSDMKSSSVKFSK